MRISPQANITEQKKEVKPSVLLPWSPSYPFHPYFFDEVLMRRQLSLRTSVNYSYLIDDMSEEFPANPSGIFFDLIEPDSFTFMDYKPKVREITMSSFFTNYRVDVPKAFKEAVPKKSYKPCLTYLKIVNMVMRHGHKKRVLASYSQAISRIQARQYSDLKAKYGFFQWQTLYRFFFKTSPYLAYGSPKAGGLAPVGSGVISISSARLLRNGTTYGFRRKTSTESLLREALADYHPLFGFNVKKVDKLRRKHSRGKTGRYEIIWKYIPKYKRYSTLLRWLLKDIRFQKARTLEDRVVRSIETLVFEPKSHVVCQLRKFVHKFVFEHHKKDVLRTLRSKR